MIQTPAKPVARPTAILAIILVSYFMILLDNSVIFTALPSLQSDLHLSTTELAWVQDAYTLVFGGLLLLGARAGDILGRRRVFVFGLSVFCAASLLIGLAPTGWWLITTRAVQGIGAAIVAPSSLSLLTASFPEGRERTRAVSWYGATAGIGASLGLVIGGALAHWISWRAGFYLNVPIGIAMIALAPRFVPETEYARGRFDLIGAVAATLGVGALVFGTVDSASAGWESPVTITSLIIGIVFLVGLAANEWRAEQPIMPPRLFASRMRTGAYLARLLYVGAMIGFFYFTTQFLQGVLGFNPLQAGVAFFPMTVVNFVVATAIPRVTRRLGNTASLCVGIALTLAGMTWLSRVTADSSYLTAVALPMALVGAGQGLAFAPLTSAGIAGATAKDAGAASGLVNTFHQLGMSLGLGILVAVASSAADGTRDTALRLAERVSAALTAGSALLGLCLVVSLALIVPASISARPWTEGAPEHLEAVS
ncbi:MFS transporter [Amycolatopsis cynarae]|uniref:MFS transporter n=1 Tax=Amycolatopsis cynarae TaxID=2995223 RepID=A0ABY7B8V4_9PSEU|nr:MFS transporter [Amycolatopsis sp. HUAS 11-8]WAL68779.1 MFS transporter [Amycolatopsis sp. HUAS 11-8]